MPNLDFLTLYIVIFLHSLTACIVWAGFAVRYRPNDAALHWLAGMALTLVGGGVLALQGNEGALIPAIAGNVIIILGFSQLWIGLRRHHNLPGGQPLAIAITITAALFMIAFADFPRGRAITYAAGQATIMCLSLTHLLRHWQPGVGSPIATGAYIIAALGQLMVIGTNIGVLTDTLDYSIYYSLASYALLCTMFSGAVWNLGFAIMLVDTLQNKLQQQSETDALTGVTNRRGLYARLSKIGDKNAPTSYAIVMIDLDNLKPLNDTFGHAVGDLALKQIARLLVAETRPEDCVARFGGDEFCILLANTSFSTAQTIASSIHDKIAQSPIQLDRKQAQLSISFGIATTTNPDTADQAIILADEALYEHKQSKRKPLAKSYVTSRSHPS